MDPQTACGAGDIHEILHRWRYTCVMFEGEMSFFPQGLYVFNQSSNCKTSRGPPAKSKWVRFTKANSLFTLQLLQNLIIEVKPIPIPNSMQGIKKNEPQCLKCVPKCDQGHNRAHVMLELLYSEATEFIYYFGQERKVIVWPCNICRFAHLGPKDDYGRKLKQGYFAQFLLAMY